MTTSLWVSLHSESCVLMFFVWKIIESEDENKKLKGTSSHFEKLIYGRYSLGSLYTKFVC